MNEQIVELIERIKALESDLEAEFAKSRANLNFQLSQGRIIFEQEIARRHRELRTGLITYILNARPLSVLTGPLIYGLIIPLCLLDLMVSIYQAVCFPVYGIAKVRRSDYLIFDRQGLAYLNAVEKLNCAYCSYANGIIAFVREVAARTEQHWCPIKHARRVLSAHPYYGTFVDYGDAEAFRLKQSQAASQSEAIAEQKPAAGSGRDRADED
ncbi:MAG: hypothetical protein ABL894_05175 [Hyphomicrobium sp.]